MHVEEEDLRIKMEIITMGSGLLMKPMVMAFINKRMDACMRVSGVEIFKMAKENKLG